MERSVLQGQMTVQTGKRIKSNVQPLNRFRVILSTSKTTNEESRPTQVKLHANMVYDRDEAVYKSRFLSKGSLYTSDTTTTSRTLELGEIIETLNLRGWRSASNHDIVLTLFRRC